MLHAEKSHFFHNLMNLLDKIGNRKELFLMGDFNARTEKLRYNQIIGEYGKSVLNDNREILIEQCGLYNLKILNGFFQHRTIHKHTWTQPTRGLQSIIDYIIGKQTNSIKVEDVRVQRGASCGSNHYLVRAKVYIPYTPSSERIPTNPNNKQNPEFKQNSAEKTHRYNLYRLSDPSVSFLYKLRLSQNLINIDDSTPETLYSNTKRAVHQAAIESIGEKNLTTERSRHWISDKPKQLVDDKKKAYNLWLNTRDTEDRKLYVRCNREVKKEIKAAKNE